MTTKTVLTCAVLVCALSVPALSDGGAKDQVKGWLIAGSTPRDFEFGTARVDGTSGKCAFIKAKIAPSPSGFGTLMQEVASDNYRGKRLRVSATIKTADAERAQLWMRVDGPDGKSLAFYNMDDRAITGTTPWRPYSIVLDVPTNATDVAFGYFLNGKGTAWADAFKLEVVGKNVPVSVMKSPDLPKSPANMDFEQ